MTDKERFQYECMNIHDLTSVAQALKIEIQEHQRMCKWHGFSEMQKAEHRAKKQSATRKRNIIIKIIKSRQMKLPLF